MIRPSTRLLLVIVLVACVRQPAPPASVTPTRGAPPPAVPTTAVPTTAGPTAAVPTPLATHAASPAPSMTPVPAATSTATPTAVPGIPPPPGLVYHTLDAWWLVNARDVPERLLGREEASFLTVSPDGEYAAFGRGDSEVRVLYLRTGERSNADASDDYAMCCPRWWPGRAGVLVVRAEPGPEMTGNGLTGIPAIVRIDGTNLRLLADEMIATGPSVPSPDGATLAYDLDGVPWLYGWDSGARPFDVQRYGFPSLTNPYVSYPAWSPDSLQLAWVVSGEEGGRRREGVGIFDLQRRTSRFLEPYEVEGYDGGRSRLEWSADGSHLFIENFGRELLWLVAADGSESRAFEHASYPAWSPDGQWLAFSLYDPAAERAQLIVVSADGQTERIVGTGDYPVWSPDGRALLFEDWYTVRDQSIYWQLNTSTWHAERVDLPQRVDIVQWIDPTH